VSGISLKPGAKTETVVVEAADTQITPTESGEKSTLINERILQNVAIVGQNAAEFVKIMPGMAFTPLGIANTPNYSASDERTDQGPVATSRRTAPAPPPSTSLRTALISLTQDVIAARR